ncbi:helicase associated protein [Jatrophihabitans sp. GAS493]|uniref:DEAD/DEAH box helicase n=1 Tax=Jatrophihabitans sp. GAS493 TaxID=1907575 RepID=UPI000BC04B21|nr:DEAD/DEAH box helicase [Jatrophihabitans sp. GAS493]SOD75047.1 helicase associated protein [Jatrophihabitans sp. GAS493]
MSNTAFCQDIGLRPHQTAAVRAAVDGLREADRVQVIMPCGTGKTLVGIGVATELRARLILVVVPTLALIRQTAERWRSTGHDLTVLFACSDHTLGSGEDAVSDDRGEVAAALNAPVTTDVAALSRTLRLWCEGRQVAAAFATYASVDRALGAAREAGVVFDLAVIDEAHHCAGSPTSAAAALARHGPQDSGVLRTRLFMTATPRTRRDETESGLLDMDDVAAFGSVVYRLSMLEAIESGLLCDYQIAVVGVRSVERVALGAAADVVMASRFQGSVSPALLAATIALGRTMKRHRIRRVLTFHSRVRDARMYAAVLPTLLARQDLGGSNIRVSASAAYSGMAAHERRHVLRRFDDATEGHAVVATNVRCLSEGIDLPALDAVLFADPRRGLVDVTQAVGRVMRPHPGKTRGLVVLPVLLPDNARRLRLTSTDVHFADTLRILRVLRDQDARLSAQLAELRARAVEFRRQPGWLASTNLPDGPLRFAVSDARAMAELSDFALRLVEGTTSPWLEHYGSLQRWSSTTGHSSIPVATVHEGSRLGGWAHEQRTLRARGLLARERECALESLPGWAWRPHDAAWERAFASLERYVQACGTSRVPQSFRVDGFGLGPWVKAQREAFRKGRLAPERASRLAVLPGWSWRASPVRLTPSRTAPRRAPASKRDSLIRAVHHGQDALEVSNSQE